MFATACTYGTESSKDLIARSGNFSVFTALQRCCPSAVRVAVDSPRDGISEHEFNKLMQAEGFIRVRDRRAVATKKDSDPDGAGLYLFSNRRWRDPDSVEDFKVLEQAWHGMCQNGVFQKECSFRAFLETVAMFRGSWKPRAGRMRRRPVPKGQQQTSCVGSKSGVTLSSAFSSSQSLASTEHASSGSATPSPPASNGPLGVNLATSIPQPLPLYPKASPEIAPSLSIPELIKKQQEVARQEQQQLLSAIATPQVQLEALKTALLLQQAQLGLGLMPNLTAQGLLSQLALQQQLAQMPLLQTAAVPEAAQEFQDGAVALAMLSKGE